MAIAPLALFAVLLLAMILSGLFAVNLVLGNLLLAGLCALVICILGVAVGSFVRSLGPKLDGIDEIPSPNGLDLSSEALANLKDVPEGTITNIGRMVCASGHQGLDQDDATDADQSEVEDTTRMALDDILPQPDGASTEASEEHEDTGEQVGEEAERDADPADASHSGDPIEPDGDDVAGDDTEDEDAGATSTGADTVDADDANEDAEADDSHEAEGTVPSERDAEPEA